MESLTVHLIVGNMLGECHAPCLLKISFVDYKKSRCIVGVIKD